MGDPFLPNHDLLIRLTRVERRSMMIPGPPKTWSQARNLRGWRAYGAVCRDLFAWASSLWDVPFDVAVALADAGTLELAVLQDGDAVFVAAGEATPRMRRLPKADPR